MDYRSPLRQNGTQTRPSQERLAKLVQVSQPFIAEIESGRKKPSVDVLMRICAVLDISLFGNGEP